MLIYVLAEHQSKVDPWMAFRVLCYLIAIWKGHRARPPHRRAPQPDRLVSLAREFLVSVGMAELGIPAGRSIE